MSVGQGRLERGILLAGFLLNFRQLLLHRVDLSEGPASLLGFGENLLTELQLLLKHLKSRWRARIHNDLQALLLRPSVNRQADLITSGHNFRAAEIAGLRYFIARASARTPGEIPDKAVHS